MQKLNERFKEQENRFKLRDKRGFRKSLPRHSHENNCEGSSYNFQVL